MGSLFGALVGGVLGATAGIVYGQRTSSVKTRETLEGGGLLTGLGLGAAIGAALGAGNCPGQ